MCSLGDHGPFGRSGHGSPLDAPRAGLPTRPGRRHAHRVPGAGARPGGSDRHSGGTAAHRAQQERQGHADGGRRGRGAWLHDPDGVKDPDHVGAVLCVEGNFLYTIEGNSGGRVAVQRYLLSDPRIVGYGVLKWKTE